MENICAIIVAAGVARCSEKFKPLLTIGDEPMICNTIHRLREGGVQAVCVVTGYLREAIEEAVSNLEVMTTFNADYFRTDMLDSIRTALRQLGSGYDRLLIMPADIPLCAAETVRRLVSTPGEVVCPVHEGRRGHPVVISRGMASALMAYRGEGGVKGAIALAGCPVTEVTVDEPCVTMDARTLPEHDRLLRYAGQFGQGAGVGWQADVRLLAADVQIDADMVQCLELIDKTGSIKKTCACLHLSYTTAWKQINRLETALGITLVHRAKGGTDGGGSHLTQRGRAIVQRFRRMERLIDDAARSAFDECFGDGVLLRPRSSARREDR